MILLVLQKLFSAFLTKPVKQVKFYESLITAIGLKPNSRVADHKNMHHSTFMKAGEQKVRILLAEDNIINQKVILKTLEKLGYRADSQLVTWKKQLKKII